MGQGGVGVSATPRQLTDALDFLPPESTFYMSGSGHSGIYPGQLLGSHFSVEKNEVWGGRGPRLHKAGFKPKISFVVSWVTVSLISQGKGRERVDHLSLLPFGCVTSIIPSSCWGLSLSTPLKLGLRAFYMISNLQMFLYLCGN